jgi:hypothetical protein
VNAACSNSTCTYACAAGFADCNAQANDGCETSLTNDVANCGSCGNACPVPAHAVNAACSNSTCTYACAAGFADCNAQANDGCETDTQWSNANCGACGKSCSATEVCTSGACVSTLTQFSCSGWTQDKSFDAVKLNGQDLEDVGGIFGFGSNELFVAAGSNDSGTVVHWVNGAWSLMPLAGDTWIANDIAGTSGDDFWVAAQGWSWPGGQMFHCLKGVCSLDPNQPSVSMFESVVLSPTTTFIHSAKIGDKNRVWRRNPNSTWTDLNGPWSSKVLLGQLSYIGGKLFVPGALFDENGKEKQAQLYMYDDSGWTSIPVPADAVQFGEVRGTSLNDLFIVGFSAGYVDKVWRLTDLMKAWTVAAQGNVGTLQSFHAGTFIAAGYQPPAVPGSLRITTGDQLTQPQMIAVDQLGYNPSAIWKDPLSQTVKVAHAATQGTVAGIYTGSCK